MLLEMILGGTDHDLTYGSAVERSKLLSPFLYNNVDNAN